MIEKILIFVFSLFYTIICIRSFRKGNYSFIIKNLYHEIEKLYSCRMYCSCGSHILHPKLSRNKHGLKKLLKTHTLKLDWKLILLKVAADF